MENQISIIINGVRYDAVKYYRSYDCKECDLKHLCEGDYRYTIPSLCAVLGGLSGKNYFEKSDKKFEP